MAKEKRIVELSVDARQFARQLDSLDGKLGKVARSAKKTEKSLGSMARTFKGGIAAVVAQLTGGLFLEFGKVVARFEDLQVTLETVTGSSEKAAAAFDRLTEFSTKTPFAVEELTASYIKLAGAGIEPTTELLTTFTDAASLATDRVGALTAITDLFSRTTAGGLGLEDLNRLQDRGLPVFDILNEKLGIARLEISELGKTAEGTRIILDALTDGLNERFTGGAEKASDTLSGATSNMVIASKNLLNAVISVDSIKDVIKDVTDFLNWLADAATPEEKFTELVFGDDLEKIRQDSRNVIIEMRRIRGVVEENKNATFAERQALGISSLKREYRALREELEELTDKDPDQVLRRLKNELDTLLLNPPNTTESATARWRAEVKELEGDIDALEQKIESVRNKPLVIEIKKELSAFHQAYGEFLTMTESAHKKWADSMTDAILTFVETGKLGFKELAASIIRDIARIAIAQQIVNPLMQGLGFNVGTPGAAPTPTPSAQGNVFNAGNVVPFAKGGVINRPILFPMKKGAGLAGEAGPEMIAPLKRDRQGNLGVASTGSSVTVNIVNQASGTEVEQRTSQDGQTIDVIITNAVKGAFNSGGLDKIMSGNFGLKRAGY